MLEVLRTEGFMVRTRMVLVSSGCVRAAWLFGIEIYWLVA